MPFCDESASFREKMYFEKLRRSTSVIRAHEPFPDKPAAWGLLSQMPIAIQAKNLIR
jgi:hypothetical protein